jgi:uncharacterized protein YdeI (YjbR/CyaY-like superfamily)
VSSTATPEFFASAADWRAWLEENAATETELLVGFWKKGTGRPAMAWSESVDEALCFGWIDAVRRRIDDDSYSIRFTRRKPTSTWSAVNVAKVAELEVAGRMTDAGRATFAARRADRTGTYAYEQGDMLLDEEPLRAAPAAWAYWPRSPRRTARSARTGSPARSGRRPGRIGWPSWSRTARPGGRSALSAGADRAAGGGPRAPRRVTARTRSGAGR